MRYLSVCSGIEAASVAWEPLGWQAAAFAEVEPFPCSVLAHRFPGVPNLGDMTRYQEWNFEGPVELVCGGTPCQPFSVAGLRKGLADPRGNLALVYLGLVDRFRPQWVVWENVPGILSSNGGRDFGAFLGALGQLGYGWSYRVLDAQHFGVPQRRRRVFVVGHLGDWRRAAAVLFERESLRGDSAKGRKAGENIAGTLASRTSGGGGLGTDFECGGGVIAFGGNNTSGPIQVSTACNAKGTRFDFESETFVYQCHGSNVGEMGTLRAGNGNETGGVPFLPVAYRTAGDGAVYEEGDRTAPLTTNTDPSANILAFSCKDHGGDAGPNSPTLRAMGHGASHANAGGQVAVAFTQNSRSEVRLIGGDGQSTGAVTAEPGAQCQNYLATRHAVRRLTPRECERLQGFPDDWTLVPHRNKTAADGPRYKAIGNSMAVPVMRWIGERIADSARSGHLDK